MGELCTFTLHRMPLLQVGACPFTMATHAQQCPAHAAAAPQPGQTLRAGVAADDSWGGVEDVVRPVLVDHKHVWSNAPDGLFCSPVGIEASDLTSLLERFEETQGQRSEVSQLRVSGRRL